MVVNINGVSYDSEKYPISIKLSDSDKKNISRMIELGFDNYVSYPEKMNYSDVKKVLKNKK